MKIKLKIEIEKKYLSCKHCLDLNNTLFKFIGLYVTKSVVSQTKTSENLNI